MWVSPMKYIFLSTLFLLQIFTSPLFAKKIIIKVPKLADTFYNDDYNLDLLKLALSKMGTEFEIQTIAQDSSQERIIRELESGEIINLFWMGCSQKNSERLLEVPIPLFRGLLGHRIFMIHKDDAPLFTHIKTIKDLQKLRGVVGNGWPDEEIMLSSGLPLVRSTYKNAFKLMNARNRAEYFPRGSYEIIPELEKRKLSLPNLRMQENLPLVYKYAVVFYVSPKFPELAKLIHQGLLKSYEDGSFLEKFRNHKVVNFSRKLPSS